MTLTFPDYISGTTDAKSKPNGKGLAGIGNILAPTLQGAQAADAVAPPPATLLDSVRKSSIFITNLGVVEDTTRTWNACAQKGNANGVWTFGTLMRELASRSPTQKATDAALSTYIKNWLSNWERSQTINGDAVAARTLVDNLILTPWLTKSQNAGAPAGQLDMRFSPFKLMAIVNRYDSRDPSPNAGVFHSGFGEGRFVFCLESSDCSGPQQFNANTKRIPKQS